MSKGLYRYFLGTSLFFIVMALSFVRIWENNNQQFWLSIWYSDRFFCFWHSNNSIGRICYH